MADDWDLQAVVRGCTTANSAANCSSSTATTTAFINSTTPAFSAAAASCGVNNLSFVPKQTGDFFSIRDMYFRNGGKEELPELYGPLLIQASPPSISPLSVIGGLKNSSQQMQHLNDQQALISKQNLSMSRTCRTKASIISSNSHNSRSKRRKKVMKRVVEIAAEALSSDTWSWRKYGQKPIKGSPYPRGYYKCSTSKGCLARKQVERKRTDPGIFIVTYTADHNHPMPLPTHRNLLAGRSSRIKPATSGEPSSRNPCSSLLVSHSVNGSPTSPELEKIEIEGNYNDDTVDEEEDMDINMDAPPELKLEEEFFEGLGELEAVSGVSNTFSENVQVQVPWLTEDIISTADQGEFYF